MEDTIIAFNDQADVITLEDKFVYTVNITLWDTSDKNHYIKLRFKSLDADTFNELFGLYDLRKALKFKSVVALQYGYNISHIVVRNFISNDNNLSLIWECSSDEPGLPLII